MNPWEDYRGTDGAVDAAKLRAAEKALATADLAPEAKSGFIARYAQLRASRARHPVSSPPSFRADAGAPGEHVIDVFGDIGESWFSDGGTTVSRMSAALTRAARGVVRIRMNSAGGDAFEGAGIKALLEAHPGHVVVDVIGLVASAAATAAMGADEIRMSANSLMMVHEAEVVNASGRQADLLAFAASLGAVNDGMVAAYAKRTKLPEADVRAMLRATTWMTAQDAVAKGFADSVTDEVDAPAMAAAADEIPAELRARLTPVQVHGKSTHMSTIRERLGLAAYATEEQITAALDAALAAKPAAPAVEPANTPAVVVPDSAEQIAALHVASVTNAVERYISAGKIAPASRAQAIAACGANAATLSACVAYWESMPAVTGAVSHLPAPAAKTTAQGATKVTALSPQQKAFAKAAKIKESDLIERLNSEQS